MYQNPSLSSLCDLSRSRVKRVKKSVIVSSTPQDSCFEKLGELSGWASSLCNTDGSRRERPANPGMYTHGEIASESIFILTDTLWDGEPTRYHRAVVLFRPPSPTPIVQLSLQWAFQHHLLHETDIGFRLIGLA